VSEDAAPPGAEDRAELVAKLAHEVRGPVSTLRGLAGTALTHYDGLSDEERREFLTLIRTEAERLERAVEHVAMALRLDADSVRPAPGAHDLAATARAVVEAEDPGEHPIEVHADGSIEASFDPSLVGTVLRELLRNAIAYSPPDAAIAVAVRTDGDHGVVEVRDGGPGIPSEQRQAVFARFAGWRPAGYETVPGTGLGLFIARALASRQGGSISIEDAPGGGTMLTVRLPGVGARGTGDDDAADL
jgi:two-component system sensor histidine kinase TctE